MGPRHAAVRPDAPRRRVRPAARRQRPRARRRTATSPTTTRRGSKAAAAAAAEWRQVVVLKGAKTVIAAPDGVGGDRAVREPGDGVRRHGRRARGHDRRAARAGPARRSTPRGWASTSTASRGRARPRADRRRGAARERPARRHARWAASGSPRSPSGQRAGAGSGFGARDDEPAAGDAAADGAGRLSAGHASRSAEPATRGRRSRRAREPIEARLARAGLPPLPRTAWLELDLDALRGNLAALRAAVGAGRPRRAGRQGRRVRARRGADRPRARGRRAPTASPSRPSTRRSSCATPASALPILVLYPIPAGHVEAAAAGAASRSTLGSGAARRARSSPRRPARPRPARRRSTSTSRSRRGSGAAACCPTRPRRRPSAVAAAPGVRLGGRLDAPRGRRTTTASAAAPGRPVRGGARGARRRVGGARARRRRAPLSRGAAGVLGGDGWRAGTRPHRDRHVRARAGRRSARRRRATAPATRLRPVLALYARPVRVVELPAGPRRLATGRRSSPPGPSRIATLPLGYGDGWRRALVRPGRGARPRRPGAARGAGGDGRRDGGRDRRPGAAR